MSATRGASAPKPSRARHRVDAERLLDGAIAGAAGTCLINATTYLDMLVRGRAGSDVPAQTAARLGALLGLPTDDADETAEHRETGAGALFGYVDGIATGVLFGLVAAGVPRPLAPLALGGAAMLAGDLTPALLGVTDPTDWSPRDWIADAVPHLVYGLVAAFVYARLASD